MGPVSQVVETGAETGPNWVVKLKTVSQGPVWSSFSTQFETGATTGPNWVGPVGNWHPAPISRGGEWQYGSVEKVWARTPLEKGKSRGRIAKPLHWEGEVARADCGALALGRRKSRGRRAKPLQCFPPLITPPHLHPTTIITLPTTTTQTPPRAHHPPRLPPPPPTPVQHHHVHHIAHCHHRSHLGDGLQVQLADVDQALAPGAKLHEGTKHLDAGHLPGPTRVAGGEG